MVNKRSIRFMLTGIVFIVFFPINNASALLIGTSQYKGGIFSRDPILISSVDATPFFTAIFPSASAAPWYQPFGTITINGGAIGVKYSINFNNPDFSEAVSLLTNNADDFIGTKTLLNYSSPPPSIYVSGLTGAGHEARALTGPGFNGIDFHGSTINNIELTVESFSSNYAFNPVIGSGVRTEYSYSLNYYEQTPVPEPATIILLGSGLAGVFIFRGRIKKIV